MVEEATRAVLHTAGTGLHAISGPRGRTVSACIISLWRHEGAKAAPLGALWRSLAASAALPRAADVLGRAKGGSPPGRFYKRVPNTLNSGSPPERPRAAAAVAG